MPCERIEHAGDLQRDPRAHDDVVHSGEHRSVDAGQMRCLDLLQKIDAHRIPVSLAGQKHFDKIGHDAEIHQLARIVLG